MSPESQEDYGSASGDDEPLFGPIERRKKLIRPRAGKGPPPKKSAPAITASYGLIFRRIIAWYAASFTLVLKLGLAASRGAYSTRLLGRCLKEMFIGLGATAVKIGQQLAIRADMLPPEVCEELEELLDAVPPFPFEQAIERIEHAAGAPLDEVYSRIDPVAIGSASIACVWQGHLKDGTKVAIKVRRPDVGQRFHADLVAISLSYTLLELMLVVRPGFFKHLKAELRSMFMEEMDFLNEAKNHWLIRRRAKKDKMKFLRIPRVYREISHFDVLVTHFVEGVPLTEVIAAFEQQDVEALGQLKRMKINPVTVGKRIIYLQWWTLYECPTFHADPHPGNIIVRPNNKIVLLDFGSCGTISKREQALMKQVIKAVDTKDPKLHVTAAMQLLEPLPAIDVESFSKDLEERTWDYYLKFMDKKSPWQERTYANLWLHFFAAAQEYQLPVNKNTVRMLRASMIWDSVGARLWHKYNVGSWFRKYQRQASRRENRRLRKRARHAVRPGSVMNAFYKTQIVSQEAAEAAELIQASLAEAPLKFLAVRSQFAVLMSIVLQVSVLGTVMVALIGVPLLVHDYLTGESLSLPGVVHELLTHPIYDVFLVFVLLYGIRLVSFRLKDVKVPDE